MKAMRVAAAVCAAASAMLASGCATQYGDHGALNGLVGGVTATRVSEDTIVVSVLGNGVTSPERVEQYVARKASEETIKDGFDWFLILGGQNTSQVRTMVQPGQATSYTSAQATAVGAYAYGSATTTTTFTAPQSSSAYWPGLKARIQMGRGPLPNGAFDARRTLAFLASLK